MEPREGSVPEMRHKPLADRRRKGCRLARRPRAGDNVTPHSGCARAPPGTTTGPCEELADGGRPGRLHCRRHAKSRAESAARRSKENAAMERREAPAFSKESAAQR